MANKTYSGAAGVEAGVPSTKFRVEQIKSEDGFTSLAVDLEALRGQIKDIIGSADYKEEITGEYAKVQIVDLAAHIDASGAAELGIKQDMAVTGDVSMLGTLDVDGEATLASAIVEDLTAERLIIAGVGGALSDSAQLTFGAAGLFVDNDAQVTGDAQIDGDLAVDCEATLASAIVSDLTATRVVFAGTAGALEDHAEMTFAAGVLTVSGSTYSKDAAIAGNLTVQGNFVVEGDTVTQNVATVTTQDSVYTLNKDAASIPAGGVGFEFEAGAAIVGYIKSNGSGDMLIKAATGGELTLDVGGNHEIAVDGNLTVEAASFVNQDLTTDAMPEFTKAKLSTLTASRLMASNADKETVSADLAAWVAGTANQISVADDADGSITLSLPQSIDTNADVEFDSLVLGDLAADAGKVIKVGSAGAVVAAAWDEFVSVEANVGLEIVQDGFKAQIGLSQDLRASASPEFAALNLGAYGDLLADGSNLKIAAAAELLLEDSYRAASSWAAPLKIAGSAAQWSAVETAFGAEKTLMEMLAACAPTSAARKVFDGAVTVAGMAYNVAAAGTWTPGLNLTMGKGDVYVNGQLQVEGAGKDFQFGIPGAGEAVKINFAYQLQVGDAIRVVYYPAATK